MDIFDSGSDVVPSDSNPLAEPLLPKVSDAILRDKVTWG